MAYLGQPRAGELRRYPDAFAALAGELRETQGDTAEEFVDALNPEGGAVAYLFRCLNCGVHRAVWDAD